MDIKKIITKSFWRELGFSKLLIGSAIVLWWAAIVVSLLQSYFDRYIECPVETHLVFPQKAYDIAFAKTQVHGRAIHFVAKFKADPNSVTELIKPFSQDNNLNIVSVPNDLRKSRTALSKNAVDVRPYNSEHDVRIHRTFWHHWSLPTWFTTPIEKGLSASAVKFGEYRANLYIDTGKNDEYIVYLWGAYNASSSQAFGVIGQALDSWFNSNVPNRVMYKFAVLIGGVAVLLATCWLLDLIVYSCFFKRMSAHVDSFRAVQKFKIFSWFMLALQAVEVMLILFLLLCSSKVLACIASLGVAVFCIWRIVRWVQWFKNVFKSPNKLICNHYLRMCQISRKEKEYDKAFEAAQKAFEFDSENPYVWLSLADTCVPAQDNFELARQYLATGLEKINASGSKKQDLAEYEISWATYFVRNEEIAEAIEHLKKSLEWSYSKEAEEFLHDLEQSIIDNH
jgi:hypothetical protein